MQKSYLWTKSKARLQCIKTNSNAALNWFFLPGGPGLGSESLATLLNLLVLPGSIWSLDFPGDGSNTTADDTAHFAKWSEAVLEATRAFNKVILVAHSSGGMFVQSIPELKNSLAGLVLMNSAPDASWQNTFAQAIKNYQSPELAHLQKEYDQYPSNENLKNLTLASGHYFATKKGLAKTLAALEHLSFNYQSHLWAGKNFHPNYQAKWLPENIPTLIFSGNQDLITPISLYSETAQFQRKNILIREIKDAAHFPWFDNPEQVKQVFDEYYESFFK